MHGWQRVGKPCNADCQAPYEKQMSEAHSGRLALDSMEMQEETAIMQDNNIANARTGSLADIGPKWINKVAWFVRITGVLILIASTAGMIQAGWPHSLRGSGNVLGLMNGTLLFVLSFLYVTKGRTRIILTAATIVLAVSVMAFSLAKLGLPHL